MLRVVGHDPGRIRLRFSPRILTALPKLKLEAEREGLAAIPGISGVKANMMTFSLTISYDPATIAPASWGTVLSGSLEEARAVLERICRTQGP